MSSKQPVEATRDRVLAFRLQRHHLDRRLAQGHLLEAAACGLQDSPPGSAALSLSARVEGLTPKEVTAALCDTKSLVRLWSLRGVPYVVPTGDVPVFTAGVLPDDEPARRYFVQGATPLLDRLGLRLDDLVAWTRVAVRAELASGPVRGKNELAAAVADWMSPTLPGRVREAWHAPHELGPTGFVLVSYVLRFVALEGLFCFGGRAEGKPDFVLTEDWLGTSVRTRDYADARAELVRRYLRCYGPSTSDHFAAWAGIDPMQARRAWQLVEPELTPLSMGRKPSWLLSEDMAPLAAAAPPEGVRLLPPHDPYLFQAERDFLLPDRSQHRQVWRATGTPGVVIVAGEIRALWRTRKAGRRLLGTLEPLGTLTATERAAIAREAERLAAYKGGEPASWEGL